MKYPLLATALLALSTPAAARPCVFDEMFDLMFVGDTCYPVLPPPPPTNEQKVLPPAKYDKPFVGTLTETTARTMQDMADWCAPHPRADRVLGCAFRYQHSPTEQIQCHIFIAPKWYLDEHRVTAEAVRLHEIAHCNGWPGNHPR